MEVGKFCKDFDGFVAKYGLTMLFFFRETKQEEIFDYYYTMDLRKVKEKITLVLRTGPRKR